MTVSFFNQRGSIALAIVIAIIGALSGVSLASVAFRDSHSFRLQLDAIQEFHILRSEIGRARLITSSFEDMDNPPQQSTLPIRKINVTFGNHRTVYDVKTKIKAVSSFSEDNILIQSLVSAVRGSGILSSPGQASPIKKYSENFIKSLQTLAIFHYFSDIDRSPDDIPGNIRFYGADVVHGRVHSNSDIWIRQIGGGNNNGWPTFYGLVSTAGEIKVYPGGGGNYPEDLVFREGLIENYPRIVFDPTAELVRQNGLRPFGSQETDDKIAYVTVDGSSFESWIGTKTPAGIEQYEIYDSYPPYGPVGNPIGLNTITIIDTIWTAGPTGSVNNRSVFVPYELWISGTFAGKQTWACADNIYLKNDITYFSTTPGLPPDGGPENLHPVNTQDYLGIISEESILIQYGHRDPTDPDSLRQKPNTSSIYIYGAICGMGDGEDDPYGDGIFTFQYHFPKGSTPDQMIGEIMWEKIDLHRFKYPTSAFNPWPPGLDYPWYNPLWPEAGPAVPPVIAPAGSPTVTYLRGTINLFGSVAQRRRGYVRRSGNPDVDNGIWDIENNIFGAAPNNIGGGPSGYDKDYLFDTRFEDVGPPDFPLVKFEGYESDELMDLGYATLSWVFKKPPNNF
jgi:hypothetical protein